MPKKVSLWRTRARAPMIQLGARRRCSNQYAPFVHFTQHFYAILIFAARAAPQHQQPAPARLISSHTVGDYWQVFERDFVSRIYIYIYIICNKIYMYFCVRLCTRSVEMKNGVCTRPPAIARPSARARPLLYFSLHAPPLTQREQKSESSAAVK